MCYDGDPADVWIVKRRRARKAYECYECSAPIPARAEYIRIKYLLEGKWDDATLHVECDALWKFVHQVVCDGEGLIMLGGLGEEIREYEENETPSWDDDGNEIPAELTLGDVFDAIRDGYTRSVLAP